MAKKGKKKSRARVTCLGCGKGLKKKWAACPKCARPNVAKRQAEKAAARTRCPRCGAVSRRAARRCSRCKAPLLLSAVGKSAADQRRDDFLAKVRTSYDPVERQGYWYAAHPEVRPPWQEGGAS